MADKKTYQSVPAGTPLISTISSGCKTPILEVKFSNLLKPFYYPNSSIPRYSITCVFDPNLHKDFINGLQKIECNEGVESIIKKEIVKENGKSVSSDNVLVKFQSKDIIPVYTINDSGENEPIILEDEFGKGVKVSVIYDILRYTKRNTAKTEHGLSFRPSAIYYHPNHK